MTNTAWQQRSQVRSPYLADGEYSVIDTPDDDEDFPPPVVAPRVQGLQSRTAVVPGPGSSDDVYPDYFPEDDQQSIDGLNPSEAGPLSEMVQPEAASTGPAQDARPRQRYPAMERLAAAQGDRPVLNKPKWWQRGLAAALGGAAGYVNAAGRTRPLDVGEGADNILHPGYRDRMARFESEIAPLEAAAKLEGQMGAATRADEDHRSKQDLQRAQAEMNRKHGSYWESRTDQERNQWKIDPKTGTLYNTITGAVNQKPPTAAERYEAAIKLGADKSEAAYYALNGNLNGYGSTLQSTPQKTLPTMQERAAMMAAGIDPDKPESWPAPGDPKWGRIHSFLKPPNPVNPLVADARQARLDEQRQSVVDRINNKKIDEEQQLLARRQSEIAAGGNLAEINQRYAPLLGAVQNQYAQAMRARGHSAPDFDVDPNTLQYRPRGSAPAGPGRGAAPVTPPAAQARPPSQVPAAPTYTEQQVRERAIARKIDPNAAVAAARKSGLLK